MLTFGAWDADRQELHTTAVWFPKLGDSMETKVDGYTIPAIRSTRIVPGFYPIILLSHDTASSRFANNDLAVALAKAGYIVIVPSHNGDTQQDSSLLYSARLFYDRPKQMLQALELVLGSTELSPYADESRIGIIGVGFGAVTALQLLGAKPNLAGINAYCGSAPQTDSFCAPWVAARIEKMKQEFPALLKKYGTGPLTPSISTFAPALESAPLPPPDPQPAVKKKTNPLSRLIKALTGDGDQPEGGEETQSAESSEPAEALPEQDFTVDGMYLRADFQVTSLYGAIGGPDQTLPSVPVTAFFRIVVDDTEETPPSPVVMQEKLKHLPAYRRPASVRSIKSAVLLTPAGGMLFSDAELQKVTVPVGIVIAGQDGLYDPAHHAKLNLPNAARLRIDNADHFSLFAPCSQELLESLGQSCGRLIGEQRASAAQARNQFITEFFKKYLGVPEDVPPPSGLVAPPPMTRLPVVNATAHKKEKEPAQKPSNQQRRRSTRPR